VLDTPPSRNALDFLDAPDRLTAFLEGGALKVFLAPAGIARITAAGASITFAGLRRLTGVNLLEDLAVFFQALSGLTEGFRRRAAAVKELLGDPATTFLVVTSPERGPVDEALYFAGRLRAAGMTFGAVIVNRVHPLDPLERDPQSTAARLEPALGPALARRVARTHAELQLLARRDATGIARLCDELDEPQPACVADFDTDVHDLRALAAVRAQLFATQPLPAGRPAPP
jgi:anion-transporting  ArsA/GET3 family ATPase